MDGPVHLCGVRDVLGVAVMARRQADRARGPADLSRQGVSTEGADPSRWSQEDIDADMFLERDEEDAEFDCHMGPGGYCGAAGSEWCEFECPYRRDQRRRP